MRLPEPLKYLAGSILIYYVMAACSAPGGTSSNPTSSNPGAASSGGASGSGGSGPGGGTPSSSGSSGGASSGSGSGSSGSSPVPDANADTTQSGSRLKAAYYVGTDGSKQFAEWQDSARGNEPCQLQTASDGVIRCLPTTTAYAQSYYANSTCTQPLGWTEGACASAPLYAYSYDTSGCPTRSRVLPITGAYTGTIYVGSTTSCTATTPTAGFTYYAVGAEIAASSFQNAALQVE